MIVIELDPQWYDPRTGNAVDLVFGGRIQVFAFKDEATKKKYAQGGATPNELKWSIAETMKKGEGVVIKWSFEVKQGEAVWESSVSELAPIVKPKVERD